MASIQTTNCHERYHDNGDDCESSNHNSSNNLPTTAATPLVPTTTTRSAMPFSSFFSNTLTTNTANTNNTSTNATNNNATITTIQSSSTWAIADFGSVHNNAGGEYLLSRDGSIHATDEVFNTGSHVAATLLSILGTALLITQASDPTYHGGTVNPWKIVSFSIYGASLILLFACSSLHHGIIGRRYERLFRILDYVAIYPLIAGTFTPLCLIFYHSSSIGWVFCATVWGISIMGILVTAVHFEKIPKWLSMTLYITLGWFGGCMSYWLYPKLTFPGFALFILGGVIYTIGGYVVRIYLCRVLCATFWFRKLLLTWKIFRLHPRFYFV